MYGGRDMSKRSRNSRQVEISTKNQTWPRKDRNKKYGNKGQILNQSEEGKGDKETYEEGDRARF